MCTDMASADRWFSISKGAPQHTSRKKKSLWAKKSVLNILPWKQPSTHHAVSVLGYTFSTNEIWKIHPVSCNITRRKKTTTDKKAIKWKKYGEKGKQWSADQTTWLTCLDWCSKHLWTWLFLTAQRRRTSLWTKGQRVRAPLQLTESQRLANLSGIKLFQFKSNQLIRIFNSGRN